MSDLSQDLEQLVIAGRNSSRPTRADFERVLGALNGRLEIATANAGKSSGASQGAKWVSGKMVALASVGVALVLSGISLWGTNRAHQSTSAAVPDESRPYASAVLPVLPVAAPDAATSEVAAPSPQLSAASNAGQARPSVPNGNVREPIRSRDNLSEEVSILARAETELHSGRTENAMKALNEHERKFPNGILAEERIAARVQALCALGRTAEAHLQLARLRPDSLHSKAARKACAASPADQPLPAGQAPAAGK